MEFLLKEREAGHIRNLGFSFHGNREGFDQIIALHDQYHWDFVQIQMNYVDWEHPNGRNTRADYLYAELDKREIPIVIMEPLRGGALSDVPAQIADQLKQREPERSIASWAFRYVGSFPRVLCALSGMTYMEHLQDNLESFLDFQPLDDEEKKFLLDMATQMEDYPLVKCTACNYCMPCPYGINIPGIFKFYNDNITAGTYVKSKEQEGYARARRKYLLAYNEAIPTVRQADHCIACRRCERDCPQNIRIPDELRRIDRYIESLKRETIE
jgi:predicted aldo/keto reductase-like oxidoreductase